MSYDDSFTPPPWWLEALTKAMDVVGWDNKDLVKAAREADGRDKGWGPDRISKMRSESKGGTVQLIQAISTALDIASPVVTPANMAEAEAMKTWLQSRRFSGSSSTTAAGKAAGVAQALDSAVEAARGQTSAVPSKDERVSSGGRPRRSPRGG